MKKYYGGKRKVSKDQAESRRIYASEILDVADVQEQKTSAVEVTISETLTLITLVN